MIIYQKIIDEIFSLLPKSPPESGGILGGTDGVVQFFFLDHGTGKRRMCGYSPNTSVLNLKIREWQQDRTRLLGVFHCHFFGVDTLSSTDKLYIRTIMHQMPHAIDSLCFPIFVLPTKKVVCYRATKLADQVIITTEKTQILNDGGLST